MTLAQFNALVERYLEEQENLDYRAALIIWMIALTHHNPKKKKPEIKDFMPQRRKKECLIKPGPPTLEHIKMMNKTLGGEEI